MNMESIQAFIDREIRPILNKDNGDIVITALEDKTLYVKMTGACSNCPASASTMDYTVRAKLLTAFPELEDVVPDDGVDQDLLDIAKQILTKHKNPLET